MSDEVIQPEATVPPVVETPGWQYGVESPDPLPQYVTKDDLRSFATELIQGLKQKDPDELDYEQRQQLQVTNAAKAEALTVVRGEIAETMAPIIRNQMVDSIAAGLSKEARDHVSNYLGKYDMNGLKGIASDKDTMDVLRRSAEHYGASKTASAPAPETLGAGGRVSNASPEIEKELAQMTAAFGGLKGFDAEVLRAKLMGEK